MTQSKGTLRNVVYALFAIGVLVTPVTVLALGPWTPVPGDGHTDVAVAVTPRDFDGEHWTFAKGFEGRIWYLKDGQTVWKEVPGDGFTDAAPCVAIMDLKPWPRILLLFVKGLDDAIWINSKREGFERWSGWSRLPRITTTHAPGCAAGHTSGPSFTIPQRNWVFVRGTNGRVYATYNLGNQSDGRPSNWKSWSTVGGLTTAVSPSAAWDYRSRRMSVFAARSSDHRIVWIQENNTTFSSWAEIGGTTNASIGATFFGDLRIFAKGIDDERIYMNTRSGTSWSGWSEVPGDGHTDAGIAAGTTGSGLRLAVKGILDFGIWQNP